jgi:hypothetical protein
VVGLGFMGQGWGGIWLFQAGCFVCSGGSLGVRLA